MPCATGLTAAIAALVALGAAPALAATAGSVTGSTARGQEWWLGGLNVSQAWAQGEGAGVTVAVLGTGVDASYPDLTGSVITGPDYTGSGRTPGSPFWGVEGTAVAGIIAGHGDHGSQGVVGIAPDAKILSVRVTLEFNDPLAASPAVSGRLPGAIASGITYAVAHGARVIDLPLDPGTLGITHGGDPAAEGGSAAERAAVAYALRQNVVLVAPSGDDGQGSGLVNYPAAYPGVIAVGAVTRGGQLAPFSSKHSYPVLTAPGVNVVAAAPPAAYSQFSSTSTASGIVAGVAALIVSRFPQLTPAQVTQALVESTVATGSAASGTSGASLPPLPPKSGSGAGYGTVNAARAVDLAADITSASQVHPSTAPPTPKPAPPRQAPRPAAAAPKHQSAGTLASSVLRYAVAGVCALIIALVVTLLAGRSRRRRRTAAAGAAGPARPAGPPAGGAHARDPRRVPAGRVPAGRVPAGPPGSDPGLSGLPPVGAAAAAGADAWPSPGGWQGGGIGEISHPASAPPPTTLTTAPGLTPTSGLSPAPKPVLGGQRARSYRASRGAAAPDGSGGPPWEPAPAPGRTMGLLPATAGSGPPPELSARIRVPGDMADSPAETTDPALPRFDLSRPPEGFDLSTPAFGLTPAGFGPPPAAFGLPAPGAAAPDLGAGAPDVGEAPADFRPALPAFGTPAELPTRQSLDFAAAPVSADYLPAPPAEDETRARSAADPGFIWDLSATDVFPAAPGSGLPPKAADTRPEPVLPPDDPQDAGGS